MKSLFISFNAWLGFLIGLLICYGIAFLLLRASLRRWRARKIGHAPAFSTFLLTSMAVFLILLPTWGVFPGRMLAEQLCHSLSHRYDKAELPVAADRLVLPVSIDNELTDFVRLLSEYGFDEVVHRAPKGSLQEPWRKNFPETVVVSVRNSGDGDCQALTNALDTDHELKRSIFQSGLNPERCVAISERGAAGTEIRISHSMEARYFPVPAKIFSKSMFKNGELDPFFEEFAFYYHETNPYRGKADGFACGKWPPFAASDGFSERRWEWEGKIVATNQPAMATHVEARAWTSSPPAQVVGSEEVPVYPGASAVIQAANYSLGNEDGSAWVTAPSANGIGKTRSQMLFFASDRATKSVIMPSATEFLHWVCYRVLGVHRDGSHVLVVRSPDSCISMRYLEFIHFDIDEERFELNRIDLDSLSNERGDLFARALDDGLVRRAAFRDGGFDISLLLFEKRRLKYASAGKPADALMLEVRAENPANVR
ncbi:MAG: hypothetical protein HYV17_04575 [Xanthomonadales bacterium]|nr:hypothetical protein [Xanthomonadales bacterium]